LDIGLGYPYATDAAGKKYSDLRDSGLHYSLFAINAMIQTAEILDNRGVNVYDYVNVGASLSTTTLTGLIFSSGNGVG